MFSILIKSIYIYDERLIDFFGLFFRSRSRKRRVIFGRKMRLICGLILIIGACLLWNVHGANVINADMAVSYFFFILSDFRFYSTISKLRLWSLVRFDCSSKPIPFLLSGQSNAERACLRICYLYHNHHQQSGEASDVRCTSLKSNLCRFAVVQRALASKNRCAA